MAKKYLLTATMPDGTVKTIGPTATAFTHYWRIVAVLENGKTEVFWGHTKSLAEARRKRIARTRRRGSGGGGRSIIKWSRWYGARSRGRFD